MIATALKYYDLQNPKEELIRHSEVNTFVKGGEKIILVERSLCS